MENYQQLNPVAPTEVAATPVVTPAVEVVHGWRTHAVSSRKAFLHG